jgi:Uma2 family endonuclease
VNAPLTRATVADLHQAEGKAELIGGRIVRFMPTGGIPGLIGGEIYACLRAYARSTGRGKAFPDGVGFVVPELSSGRESFSPDAAYYSGAETITEDFVPDAPTFAVEVRSKTDRGPSAEAEMASKRADYFEAGTLVVWDVDYVAETVACYRNATDPPAVWKRGDVAHAEPAVPGWTMPVNDIFA